MYSNNTTTPLTTDSSVIEVNRPAQPQFQAKKNLYMALPEQNFGESITINVQTVTTAAGSYPAIFQFPYLDRTTPGKIDKAPIQSQNSIVPMEIASGNTYNQNNNYSNKSSGNSNILGFSTSTLFGSGTNQTETPKCVKYAICIIITIIILNVISSSSTS